MRNLPLFYYPSTWLYVDDDSNLLQCVGLVLDEHNRNKLFQSPEKCVAFLADYQSPLMQKSFLSSNKQDDHYGILHHTPVDFDVTKLLALTDNPERYNEITAMVIDYDMPTMNGFALSKACDHLRVEKILLTGKTEDTRIIDGFNKNYIQHYIQKGCDDFESLLIDQLVKSTFHYFQRITAPLLSHLEAESQTPLSDLVFSDFFLSYCKRKNVAEYYLIDKQGSFLCIDKNGNQFFFVVHTDRGVNTWLETYYTGSEFTVDFANDIVARRRLPFFGYATEAWQIDSTEWHSYFHQPQLLEGRERYYWFEIQRK